MDVYKLIIPQERNQVMSATEALADFSQFFQGESKENATAVPSAMEVVTPQLVIELLKNNQQNPEDIYRQYPETDFDNVPEEEWEEEDRGGVLSKEEAPSQILKESSGADVDWNALEAIGDPEETSEEEDTFTWDIPDSVEGSVELVTQVTRIVKVA